MAQKFLKEILLGKKRSLAGIDAAKSGEPGTGKNFLDNIKAGRIEFLYRQYRRRG